MQYSNFPEHVHNLDLLGGCENAVSIWYYHAIVLVFVGYKTMGVAMATIRMGCVVFLLGVCLSACHSVPKQEKQYDSWRLHQQSVAEVCQWSIDGKFSFHKDKTTLGSFSWQQNKDDYTLQFVGPLSVGSAHIHGNAHEVRFQQKGGEALVGDSPEALLRDQMGWDIPLAPLRYWVKGQVVPGEHAQVLWDKRQHLRDIKQMGWEVVLADYIESKGKSLPTRLTLKREGLWVKLVIKTWQWGA